MKAKIVKEEGNKITVQVEIELEGEMLDMEEHIQQMVNEVGLAATLKALEKFDSQGEPLTKGGKKLSKKGQLKKSISPHTDGQQ